MERILFLFIDGSESLVSLNNQFFPIGLLLNRLLNEKYKTKDINLINLKLLTERTYQQFPSSEKYYIHRAGKILWYNDVFDYTDFVKMALNEQRKFLWDRANAFLIKASDKINNPQLKQAAMHAYAKGLELCLNPDYILLQDESIVDTKKVKADLWMRFTPDKMYSELVITVDNRIIYDKVLEQVQNGVEVFIDMYKSIKVENDRVVVKGHKHVDYLPLTILLMEVMEGNG